MGGHFAKGKVGRNHLGVSTVTTQNFAQEKQETELGHCLHLKDINIIKSMAPFER